MARRTNKTAHVLNLIAGSGDEDTNVHEVDNMPEAEVESFIENTPNDDSPDTDSVTNSIESNIAKVSNSSDPNKNNSSAPTLEILFNDHDPLSDLVKHALEDVEDMDNSEKISAEKELATDNTASLEDNSLDLNHDTQNESPDSSENLSNVQTGPDDSLPDDSNHAAQPDTDNLISEQDKPLDSLLNELEKSNRLHCHDRKNLNSMLDLDFKYVNVYERIVQDKILSYMRKFDMCMCDRCIIDTFALTLTFLPTKIVVVDREAIFPMISYYEAKNTAMISTALIKACMMVIDRPNH